MEEDLMTNGEQDYQEFPAEGDYNPVEDSEGLNVQKFKDLRGEEAEPARPFNEAQGKPIFTKAIRWLVYAAAFLTPLWFLPFTADVLEFNKQVLIVAIAGIGLVLYLIDVIKSGVVKYRRSAFYWPLIGVVVAGIISVIFSVNRNVSLFGIASDRSFSLVTLASFAVIFFLGLNSAISRKVLRGLVTLSLTLVFLFGALQMLGVYLLRSTLFATPSFNTVGSANALGFLAAVSLALFASVGLARPRGADGEDENTPWSKALTIVQYVGLLLALFMVVLINWWPVWTVAFVSLLALVSFGSAEAAGSQASGSRFKMRLFAFPMAVIVIGVFLMLINFNWAAIKSKFPLEVAPAYKVSASVAWDSIKSRPMGYGLENFSVAFDKLKPAATVNSVFYQLRFTDATSEIVNMATNGGLLMLLAFLAFLWFYGRELVFLVKNRFFQESEASPVWAASAGLLAVVFLYPANMATAAVFVSLLILGLAYEAKSCPDHMAERTLDLESHAKLSFAGSIVFVVGLVLVLVSAYFTVNNYIANVYLAKALSTGDIDKAISYFAGSVNSNGSDPRVPRLLSQAIVAKLSNDLKNGPQKDESKENYNARLQNLIASAVNISARATDVDPANSQNWANRGLIYQNLIGLVGGADQAAVGMYNESLKRDPADPLTYLRIGNVYLAVADSAQSVINNPPAGTDAASLRKIISDDLAKAEDSFKQAIALYNNYGDALYNIAAVYDRQGKLLDAIKQFEKLQAANQQDPSILFQLGLLYYRNNQKDNAFNAWQRAVTLFPNYSNARWYLSLVYEERGDLASALAQVQEIQKLNPDNAMVQQRLAQLEAGQRTIPPEKVLNKKPL